MTVLALATDAYEADRKRLTSRRRRKDSARDGSRWASHRQALIESRATIFALAKLSQSAENSGDGNVRACVNETLVGLLGGSN